MSEPFPYEDILHKNRPVHQGDEFSRKHPSMSLKDRAKIFSPFAALKGYEDAIIHQQEIHVPEDELERVLYREEDDI